MIQFLICIGIDHLNLMKLRTRLMIVRYEYLRVPRTFPLPPLSTHCFEMHLPLKYNILNEIHFLYYEISILQNKNWNFYIHRNLLLSLCCWDVSLLQIGSPWAAKSLSRRYAMVNLMIEALSSWEVIAPGRGSILASS